MRLFLAIAFLASSGFAAQTSEGLRGVESLSPGVYYRAADGTWVKMDPISSQGFQSRARFMSAKAVTVYSGATSTTQIEDHRPTFYLKEPMPVMGMTVVTQGSSSSTTVATQGGQAQTPASGATTTTTRDETSSTYSISAQPQDARSLIMVRLEKKKKSRELTYAGGIAFNFRFGVNSDDVVETALTPIDGGGFTLRPKTDLKPGEYMIVTRGVMGMTGYGYGYDFGIVR